MSNYRNQGKGQPHTDGPSSAGLVPVDLDQLLIYGNRSQRRWAQQQLDALKKRQAQEKGQR